MISRNDRLAASASYFLVAVAVVVSYLAGTIGMFLPLMIGSVVVAGSLLVLIISALEDE
jgi:hypothetical protein